MGWFRDHRFGVLLGAFLVFGSMLALVLGYVALVLSAAFQSPGGESVVEVLGDLLIPFLPIIGILLIVTLGSGISLGWAVLQRLSLPRSKRLQSTAERMEQSNSLLDTLGLSDFVAPPEPSDEEKLEALKEQYVNGEINEEEFERRIERLNATGSDDGTRSSRVSQERESNTNREW